MEETTSPEPVDEQIESLLVDLDEADESEESLRVEEAYSASRARRAQRKRRSARRQYHRHYPLSQFDLFFVVTAVVLGFAVGLLTVFLVNG